MQRAQIRCVPEGDVIVVHLTRELAVFRCESAGHAATANVADARGLVDPLGLAAEGRGLHESRPRRHRNDARESATHDLLRLVESDPDTSSQFRREAYEPGIGVIVGGAGLAACRQLESALSGTVARSVIDDV